jgi:hypothetical protein
LIEETQADECAPDVEESLVHVGAALVAEGQPAELVEPGEGALDHPPEAPQLLAGVDALARDPTANAPPAEGPAAVAGVKGLVRVELGGALPRGAPRAPDARDGIDQFLEDGTLVDVGGRDPQRQRDALPVDRHMPLAARLAAIGGIRAGLEPPLLAGTVAASTAARSQSIPLRAPSPSRMTWCNACQTPAWCHSRKRRQQVTPLPQPISCGSNSPGMPLRRTNRMPVSAARSGTRGRPPFRLGFSGGKSGSIAAHSVSETSGRVMPQAAQDSRHLPRF